MINIKDHYRGTTLPFHLEVEAEIRNADLGTRGSVEIVDARLNKATEMIVALCAILSDEQQREFASMVGWKEHP